MTQNTNKVLSLLVVGVASAAIVAFPAAAPAAAAPDNWSREVTSICAHALLFEGSHEIGTRAGAVAVAADIRASTERRLTRIAALLGDSDSAEPWPHAGLASNSVSQRSMRPATSGSSM